MSQRAVLLRFDPTRRDHARVKAATSVFQGLGKHGEGVGLKTQQLLLSQQTQFMREGMRPLIQGITDLLPRCFRSRLFSRLAIDGIRFERREITSTGSGGRRNGLTEKSRCLQRGCQTDAVAAQFSYRNPNAIRQDLARNGSSVSILTIVRVSEPLPLFSQANTWPGMASGIRIRFCGSTLGVFT